MKNLTLNKYHTLTLKNRLIPLNAIFGELYGVHYYVDKLGVIDNKFLEYIWIYDNITTQVKHVAKRGKHVTGDINPAKWRKVYFTKNIDKRLRDVFLSIQKYVVGTLNKHPEWQALKVRPALGYSPNGVHKVSPLKSSGTKSIINDKRIGCGEMSTTSSVTSLSYSSGYSSGYLY